MSSEAQEKYAAFRAAKMIRLFGPPPVLSTESVDVYEKVLAGLGQDFSPKSTVEMMLVRDFADCSWEIFRLRRHKTLVIELKVRQLRQTQADRAKIRAQGEQTRAQGKAQEVRKPQTALERIDELEGVIDSSLPDINNILTKPAEEFEHAKALESTIGYYQKLDMMENLAVARRHDILRQLECCKEGWGGHLSRVWNVIEVECQEANQQLNEGGPPAAPLSEAAE